MKDYTARVERDGRFWLVTVVELGRVTQARHLREVEEMARDLIAVVTEVSPDSFGLRTVIELPTSVREKLDEAAVLREQAATAQASSAAAVRSAARELAGDGVPVRDIGIALGVSYQRAHQLLG